jgi:hypothetical protein
VLPIGRISQKGPSKKRLRPDKFTAGIFAGFSKKWPDCLKGAGGQINAGKFFAEQLKGKKTNALVSVC